MKKTKPFFTAYQKALWLLGRREYGYSELILALTRKEYTLEDSKKAVEKLMENGYQSDQRAAISLMSNSSLKKEGSALIKARARTKGLNDELIKNLIVESDVDWLIRAERLVLQKFGSGPFDQEKQIKIVRLLMRKGFDLSIAWKIAKQSEE